jgi:hypothetical protein
MVSKICPSSTSASSGVIGVSSPGEAMVGKTAENDSEWPFALQAITLIDLIS